MLDYINQFTVSNDVRMRRATFKGAFLLVEGRSDQKLYVKFTDASQTQVVVCRTKDDAVAAILALNADNFAGVLAIVDADFDRIEGRIPTSENLFCTDQHDAEVMMVASDRAINALMAEFSSPEKLVRWRTENQTTPVSHLLGIGSKMGALLLYSLRSDAALDFGSFKNGLKLTEFVNERNLEFNFRNFIQHVLNRSGRPHAPLDPILDGVMAILAEGHHPTELCRGHDLADLIGFSLRSAIGSCQQTEVAGHTLEGYLRVAYSPECFGVTNLWADVISWQESHEPYIIFS